MKTQLAASARLSRTPPLLYDLVLEESSLEEACDVLVTFLDSYWCALLPSVPRPKDSSAATAGNVNKQNVLPTAEPATSTAGPTPSQQPSNKKTNPPQNHSAHPHLNTLAPHSNRSSTLSSGPVTPSLRDDDDAAMEMNVFKTAETRAPKRSESTKEKAVGLRAQANANANAAQSKHKESVLSALSSNKSQAGALQRMYSANSSGQRYNDDDSDDEFQQRSPAPSVYSQPPPFTSTTTSSSSQQTSRPEQQHLNGSLLRTHKHQVSSGESQSASNSLHRPTKSEHQLSKSSERSVRSAAGDEDADGDNPAIVFPVFQTAQLSHVAISVTKSSPQAGRTDGGAGKTDSEQEGSALSNSIRLRLLTPSPLVSGGRGGMGTGTGTTSGTEASSLETTPSQSALSFNSQKSAPPAVQRGGTARQMSALASSEKRPGPVRQITVHD